MTVLLFAVLSSGKESRKDASFIRYTTLCSSAQFCTKGHMSHDRQAMDCPARLADKRQGF